MSSDPAITPGGSLDPEFVISQDPLITRGQLDRASAALTFFVPAWNLPLNPEDLDLMAYAALLHAGTPAEQWDPDTAESWQAIEDSVTELIEEDRQKSQLLKDAMEHDSQARHKEYLDAVAAKAREQAERQMRSGSELDPSTD